LPLVKKSGCRVSIDTDAHGASQLWFVEYGLAAALTAGIERERIINFMSRKMLLRWAASVRGKA
jgi:histidinol phosphatase-like PHP family hydrolase